MTQEELIKKIDAEITKLSDNACLMAMEDGGYRVACMDVSDILHKITKEMQPSLPSNLNEAAERCRWRIEENRITDDRGDYLYSEADIEDAFKAGAEWM